MAKTDASIVQSFSPAGFERAFRTVELDNWNGSCVMSKRTMFKRAQHRHEFLRPGVYIIYETLLDAALPKVYVGEGDPILPRLQKHHKEREFWTDLIAFSAVGDALTKTRIQYIEHRLLTLAHAAKRCDLQNKNVPDEPTLSESERAYADRFIENILDCLLILNIRFFHVPERGDPTDRHVFELKGKGAIARGFQSDDGFTVAKDSTATKQLTNAFRSSVLRNSLIKEGVLEDAGEVLRFTQDYEFGSPSAAAQMVYGNPMNGLEEWKTPQGQTLKQIQASEVIENIRPQAVDL